MLLKTPTPSRAICAAIRSNGFACLTRCCCFTRSRRRSKHRAPPISSCVSPCPKTVHGSSSNAWQKWILLRQWQRIDRRRQMQKFNAYIFRFGAIAVTTLISLNANADPVLVDVRSVYPTITVDLRYAGRKNFLGHSLYPRGSHALVRPEVASALADAQSFLRRSQYGLKIWDAYRPVAVQAMLWQASHNSDYVANPDIGA